MKQPLSRPVSVEHLPQGGLSYHVDATLDECKALAADFNLPAILELKGTFELTGSAKRIKVQGRVTAKIQQTCVVSLEAFPAAINEEVETVFVPSDRNPIDGEMSDVEEYQDGAIDLGVLTAETLSLGLDPYPRKPGVAFSGFEEDPPVHPFAVLAKLKRPE